MPAMYLVVDRDEPRLEWPLTKVGRTLEDARALVKTHEREHWPTWVVVLVHFQPSHEELVALFNAQWPDLTDTPVNGLWRITNRGALRPVDLPPGILRLDAVADFIKGMGVTVE